METFERFFLRWCLSWVVISTGLVFYVWGYAWWTNLQQPVVVVFSVGILFGLLLCSLTVVFPGIIYGAVLDIQNQKQPTDPGLVDGAGI